MLNIDKISCKTTSAVIYDIGYITVSTDNKNPFCLIFNNVGGYIRKSNEDRYLLFTSTNKNKKVFKKYEESWDEIKNQIKAINGGETIEYKQDFKKIRFKSDNDLKY